MLSVMGFSSPVRQATDLTALTDLSLEDLLKVPIVDASKYRQSEVAAAASLKLTYSF